MKIDSHQHFWKYDEVEYPWIQADWPIRRSYLPNDLEPQLQVCDISGSVAVQARQSLSETDWLLQLADADPMIFGVVGWVALQSTELRSQLERYVDRSKFVGVRHVVQDEPDDRFMLRPDFKAGIATLREFGLTYDILIYPKQLPAALALVGDFPDQPFVIDHMAKPSIAMWKKSEFGKAEFESWKRAMQALAIHPNVCCKVSGMVTEASWGSWTIADFEPYLAVVLEAFGPQRLLYGSDWPVALLSARYEDAFGIVRDYFGQLSDSEREQVFGGNAKAFYGLSVGRQVE